MKNHCGTTIVQQFREHRQMEQDYPADNTIMVLAENRMSYGLFPIDIENSTTPNNFQCYAGQLGKVLIYRNYLAGKLLKVIKELEVFETFIQINEDDFQNTACQGYGGTTLFLLFYMAQDHNMTLSDICFKYGPMLESTSRYKRNIFDALFGDSYQELAQQRAAINTDIDNILILNRNVNSAFSQLHHINDEIKYIGDRSAEMENESQEYFDFLYKDRVILDTQNRIERQRINFQMFLSNVISETTERLQTMENQVHSLVRLLAHGKRDCVFDREIKCSGPPYLLTERQGKFVVTAPSHTYIFAPVAKFHCLPRKGGKIFKHHQLIFRELNKQGERYWQSIDEQRLEFPSSCSTRYQNQNYFCSGLVSDIDEDNSPFHKYGFYIIYPDMNIKEIFMSPVKETLSFSQGGQEITLKQGQIKKIQSGDDSITVEKQQFDFESLARDMMKEGNFELDILLLSQPSNEYQHWDPTSFHYDHVNDSTNLVDILNDPDKLWENAHLFRKLVYGGSTVSILAILFFSCLVCYCMISRGWCCDCCLPCLKYIFCRRRPEAEYRIVRRLSPSAPPEPLPRQSGPPVRREGRRDVRR